MIVQVAIAMIKQKRVRPWFKKMVIKLID